MSWEDKFYENEMNKRMGSLNQGVFEKSPLKDMPEAEFIALQKKNEEISNAIDEAKKQAAIETEKLRPGGGKKKTKKHKRTLKKKKNKRGSTRKRK